MSQEFLQNLDLNKFPRTPHLQGSRYQPGDKGAPKSYSALEGRYIVAEEKLDAANTGFSFARSADMLLQSRGHYLDIDRMGGRDRQFNLFKQWGRAQEGRMLEVLEDRYVMYGEFMLAKHSMFYDNLPHLFCEFDIWDRSRECFLDTASRHALLEPVPVVSVPVLYAGVAPKRIEDLHALVGPSVARTSQWRESFENAVEREKLDLVQCWQQTDKSEHAEGLYIKVEENGKTVARYKLVRPDFIQTIIDSDSHHSDRPIIPNGLRPGVDLFAAHVDKTWACESGGRMLPEKPVSEVVEDVKRKRPALR